MSFEKAAIQPRLFSFWRRLVCWIVGGLFSSFFLLPLLIAQATDLPKADRILVEKAQRKLTLWKKGEILKTYVVSLGSEPVGHKQQEGDNRTPEGIYKIDWRNPQSRYHLSLHISYPNDADVRSAKKRGVSPGGDIMIHGLPNGLRTEDVGSLGDWTIGCIAVNNLEIEEIWKSVADGTEIEIRP